MIIIVPQSTVLKKMTNTTIIHPQQYEFFIPEVPKSVNHLYGHSRYGRRYMKKAGKEFKEMVKEIVNKLNIPEDFYNSRISIKFTIYFKSHRKRDLDNCMKILWDSLEGCLFKNDSQIDVFTVKRAFNKYKPGVKVKCSNIC